MKWRTIALSAVAVFGFVISASFGQEPASTPNYQKIADALRVIADEVAKMGPPAAPVTPAPSPTPTPTPSVPQPPVLTDARIAEFKAMQTANTPAWQRLKAIADNSKLTPNPNGDDPGLAAAIVYKVTGDKSYADAAWKCLLAYSGWPPGAPYDGISDAIVELPVVYAAIKDAGTADQQKQFIANITEYAKVALGTSTILSGGGGMPASNANYTGPFYFGLALLDQISGTDYLSQTSSLTSQLLPLGGLDATGVDRKTARNCISDYISLSKGGAWLEGPYDCKSVPRLILGWAAMMDLTGVDHYPEIAKWVPEACDAALLDYAADFVGYYPWGDRTRLQLDYARRLSIYAALQGAAQRIGDADRVAKMSYLIDSILAKMPINQIETHFWFFYAPTMTAGKRPADPVVNYSPGVGVVRRADGNSLFAATFPSTLDLNHEQIPQDVFWYAGGENVIERPYGYSLQIAGVDIAGATSGNCYGMNSVAVCGLNRVEQSGPLDHASTADYTYFVGETKGLMYGSGPNLPNVEWLHELTRTVFCLPGSDVVLVCDRVRLDDPRKLDLSKYNQPHRAAILAADHLVEQVWHAQTQPTVTVTGNASSVTWATASGREVQATSISTAGDIAVDPVDENVLWAGISSIAKDEKHWQFRVRPAADQSWTCIVTCLCISPSKHAIAPDATGPANTAGFVVDGKTILFGIDQTSRLIDPASVSLSGAYLVGCSGSASVVKKP